MSKCWSAVGLGFLFEEPVIETSIPIYTSLSMILVLVFSVAARKAATWAKGGWVRAGGGEPKPSRQPCRATSHPKPTQ